MGTGNNTTNPILVPYTDYVRNTFCWLDNPFCEDIISSLLVALIVFLFSLLFGKARQFYINILQRLYNLFVLLLVKAKEVFLKFFPYRICNKNKIRDYVFIQAKHDWIVLNLDINTTINPLKKWDIRKIKYEYYKDINNFDDWFKLLDYNDVLCVSYTDKYINKYIKENHKRVKDQNTIEALYHNMSKRVYYILKPEFNSYKYKN